MEAIELSSSNSEASLTFPTEPCALITEKRRTLVRGKGLVALRHPAEPARKMESGRTFTLCGHYHLKGVFVGSKRRFGIHRSAWMSLNVSSKTSLAQLPSPTS